MKYFQWSFSPLPLFKKGVISFWGENVHKYWLNVLRTKPAQEKVWLGKLPVLDMTQMD